MRLSVGTKLLSGYVVVIALFAGTLGLSYMTQRQNEASYNDLLNRLVEEQVTAQDLQAMVESTARSAYAYMLDPNPTYRDQYDKAKAAADADLATLQKDVRSDKGKQLLSDAAREYAQFIPKLRSIFDSGSQSGEQAKATLAGIKDVRTTLNTALDALSNYADSLVSDTSAQLAAGERRMALIELLAALVAGALGLGVGVLLSRSIARTTGSLAAAAERIAQGDLTLEALPVRSGDELGAMTRSFNQMVQNLRRLIEQVQHSAQTVAESAGALTESAGQVTEVAEGVARAVSEVADGASAQSRSATAVNQTVGELRSAISQIATGAQDQAANAQNSSSGMGLVVTGIDDVVAKAGSVLASSQQAKTTADESGRSVRQAVAGMNQISAQVHAAAERMSQLSRQSEQIGVISQVITEIADQTNLLALNAAIEAARAGEHGRGFAVVADEVRKLAERAGRSAGEISGLIAGMQTATQEVGRLMSQGRDDADQGARLATGAGASLDQLLLMVEQTALDAQSITEAARQIDAATRSAAMAVESVSAVTEENTAATEQMAAGADQVTREVQEMAAVSEENAASAEEVSASVEEMNATMEEIASAARGLADVAHGLQAQVAAFRL